ncbi:MAG: jacalin-like lectin domain protein [Segetibacter sp.]|nr:jacalin-like lectin domain protein [Segetibacter sp.]
MKKFNVILLLFISFFIFSCNKSNEVVAPQTGTQPSAQPSVPEFNESNSTKVSWDQLPEKMKNAIPIDTASPVAARSNGAARSLYSQYTYSTGPWGGNGGSYYSIAPPNGSRIYAIAIRSGAYIDRLTVWYVTSNGTIYVGGNTGGNGGAYYLQYFSADEYIYAVTGGAYKLVDRLTFYTNKKWFRYGGSGGVPFQPYVRPNHQILGFYGRSGIYLDQIGFYIYSI